jgi:hypothetical protein
MRIKRLFVAYFSLSLAPMAITALPLTISEITTQQAALMPMSQLGED